jgi:hypothetical protein
VRLRTTLSKRFSPPDPETAYRCEFKTRRRNQEETTVDYGYYLKQLTSRAFPNIPMAMHKSLIIEQFVSGLGNQVLKRHAQFPYLYTLDRTISIAVEFEDFEGVNVQYRIPIPDEMVTSVNAIKQNSNTEHIDLKSANWRNRLTTCMTQMANITKSQSPNRRHFRNNRHNYRTSKECNTCKRKSNMSVETAYG